MDVLLADDWCGTERSIADQDSGPRLPYYKVIYAYASDVGDRFAHFAPVIERYTKAAGAKVAMYSDKTVRFDRRTSCGPSYLDIRTLALPDNAYYYGGGIATRIPDALRTLLPQDGPQRNYLVFVDLGDSGDYYALGQPYDDDSPTAANLSDTHTTPALAYIVGGGGPTFWPTAAPRAASQFADTILQEILHNLGAVQKSAPHSSGDWHCWQGWDVMCYQSRPNLPAVQYDCPWQDSFADAGAPLDCGGDDYFNPRPAPGSYLDTHWNTYNSVYLCPLDDCGAVPRTAVTLPPPAPSTAGSAPLQLVQTHVIVRPAPHRVVIAIARRGRRQSLRAVLARGLRVRFSATGGSTRVRAVLRAGARTVAVRRVTAGRSMTLVFGPSRALRRELRRGRRTVLHLVLTAAHAKPARATLVVTPAGAPAP
jgi:hypothetical protein